MQAAEQITLKWARPLSSLCHLAKNLYNEANFYFRQFFFHLGEQINYYDLQFALQESACYRALPAQTAQQTLKLVIQNWASFFAARREYRRDPAQFLGCPRPPYYKARDGECVAIFTNQNTRLKGGYIHFPKKCSLRPVKTRVETYHQIRIIPKECGYTCEVVYDRPEHDLGLDKTRAIGIDLGLRNLATGANNIGLAPFVVKGGLAKSVNQFYNKKNAAMQRKKDVQKQDFQTRRQQQLLKWRNNKVRDIFHKISRKIITYCTAHDIGTIVIGHNKNWKQGLRLGARTNQNFVQVPLSRLVQMVTYKAQLAGITVVEVDEAYTSKCSALDNEAIGKHACYAGKRVSRGLFRTATGHIINADANAAANILRKAVPEAFRAYGIEGLALVPQLLAIL